MPTLIRLVISLLFLAGIAYGAMFALVAYVKPPEREVTVRIPARDLLGEQTPTSRVAPPPAGSAPQVAPSAPAPTSPAIEPPEAAPASGGGSGRVPAGFE